MRIHSILLSAFILIWLGTTACSREKTTDFKERPFISLAGEWESDLGTIRLPGTVDASRLAPAGNDTTETSRLTRRHPFVGKIQYTREIHIPDSLGGKEMHLVMERAKPSTVWIDSDSIGHSSLLLSPQIYAIGKLTAGKHRITIEVDNTPESVPKGIHGSHAWTEATQTNWNGIIGRFGIEAGEGIRMEEIQIFATAANRTARVTMEISSPVGGRAIVAINGYTWNTKRTFALSEQIVELDLRRGTHRYTLDFATGREPALWSEFDPALYKVNFALECAGRADFRTVDFGIRDFGTANGQFTINSLKTFLRGKHDACVFPLTGYPPMTKEEWKRQMRIAKEYGMNHYRFHSWTPPQAAFDAANEEGIYMQAELPYWGSMERDKQMLNEFLSAEGKGILRAYGNNPSFVMMALGNELGGDISLMREMTDALRSEDKGRRLFAFGANNMLGTAGQVEGEDFLVTCRVGGEVGSADFSTHTRATFSFADARDGGYINGMYPSTQRNYSGAIADVSVPVISHESGQFQVYPDYDEIEKYTGVLYPYNLEIFRRRLDDNRLGDQAKDFHRATGRFAALCYKADIEMCFRTPNFGGFQILDLQDYPGQGSAYVGLLDAFMDSKGAITPEEFRGFCGEIVPMVEMHAYTWTNDQRFEAKAVVSNYSAGELNGATLEWELKTVSNPRVIASGSLAADIPQGSVTNLGTIAADLKGIDRATELELSIRLGRVRNSYSIWVYLSEVPPVVSSGVTETKSPAHALELLTKGESVILFPEHNEIIDLSVGGLFTPDYWNYAMFKSISESLGRTVSPGTLSILTDPTHPLFDVFPTDSHSNWQWWSITRNSRPFILNGTPADYKPIIQVIDNIERNHKLGLLFEMAVDGGKLLVCMCDPDRIGDKPEGRQFRHALHRYAASDDFNPQFALSPTELLSLFNGTVKTRTIVGVRNITTYQ